MMLMSSCHFCWMDYMKCVTEYAYICVCVCLYVRVFHVCVLHVFVCLWVL